MLFSFILYVFDKSIRCADNHGNPWLAIVVDPLLSMAKSTPEIRAFRVYPAGFTPPKNQTPDGTVVSDVKVAIERWGACWDNYYSLEVSYFMSQLAQSTLNSFRDKFTWMSALTASPHGEPEKQRALLELIGNAQKEARDIGKAGGGIRQSFALSAISPEGEVGSAKSAVSDSRQVRFLVPITTLYQNTSHLLYNLSPLQHAEWSGSCRSALPKNHGAPGEEYRVWSW